MSDVRYLRDKPGLRVVDTVALVLLIIGGLNWGLVGLFAFDLVAAVFGGMTVLSRLVYILVGVSAVWTAVRTPHLVHTEHREPYTEPTPPPHAV